MNQKDLNKQPILVVMAAGMGSRYGGLKQLDPIGPCGEVILDYSVYDAYRAGFRRVIFIIKHEFEQLFIEKIGNPISKYMEVTYAFQELEDIPDGYAVPEGRNKPWGTGHAVLAARNLIDAPFAVINSDDYYGLECYQHLYDFLTSKVSQRDYCMIGYKLKNTVSSSGAVTRGICQADEENNLASIFECRGIETKDQEICYPERDKWIPLDKETLVSMNMWGYSEKIIPILEQKFSDFLSKMISVDPLKSEFLLPEIVHDLILEDAATIHIIPTSDVWCGVTYKEDRNAVAAQMAKKTSEKLYPLRLWK